MEIPTALTLDKCVKGHRESADCGDSSGAGVHWLCPRSNLLKTNSPNTTPLHRSLKCPYLLCIQYSVMATGIPMILGMPSCKLAPAERRSIVQIRPPRRLFPQQSKNSSRTTASLVQTSTSITLLWWTQATSECFISNSNAWEAQAPCSTVLATTALCRLFQ